MSKYVSQLLVVCVSLTAILFLGCSPSESTDSCGDGICSTDETCGSCADDCGTCSETCGDGTCDADETCSSCADDCGTCSETCGNGTCDADETCSSCADDCGTCCDADSCLNGGTCSVANGQSVCECAVGYSGERCETDLTGACSAVCGDEVCGAEEDCATCPGDCGACSPTAQTYYVTPQNSGCSDSANNGTQDSPWCTVAKALEVAVSGDTVLLGSGNHGSFSDSSAAQRTGWLTFKADVGQAPVFDRISASGTNRDAYLRFDGIEVLLPEDSSCQRYGSEPSIVALRGVNYIAFVNTKIHGVHTLQSSRAIEFKANGGDAPHHLIVDRSEIYDAGSGIRFHGTDITISRSHIHHVSSSMIGALAGMGASFVTVDCNEMHDMGLFPSERCYDEGDWSEVHASSISVRGHDYRITRNRIYDSRLGIQLYDDDAGGVYDLSNITLEYNLIYSLRHSYTFYNPGPIDGPIVIRNNTFIGQERENAENTSDPLRYRFHQSLSINLGRNLEYAGAGTIVRDNLVIENFTMGIKGSYADHPWILENNLIYAPVSGGLTLDPSNMIIIDRLKDSSLPQGFIDDDLFEAPYYSVTPDGRTCAPGNSCDFTPKAGSVACTFSSTGSYVGAIPCP